MFKQLICTVGQRKKNHEKSIRERVAAATGSTVSTELGYNFLFSLEKEYLFAQETGLFLFCKICTPKVGSSESCPVVEHVFPNLNVCRCDQYSIW